MPKILHLPRSQAEEYVSVRKETPAWAKVVGGALVAIVTAVGGDDITNRLSLSRQIASLKTEVATMQNSVNSLRDTINIRIPKEVTEQKPAKTDEIDKAVSSAIDKAMRRWKRRSNAE